jgi:hypothetical protein
MQNIDIGPDQMQRKPSSKICENLANPETGHLCNGGREQQSRIIFPLQDLPHQDQFAIR